MDQTYQLNGAFKPTLKRRADLEGPDFFPTPEWATAALMDVESFEGSIWEPACGDGSMARVLASQGNEVFSSDLYDRGFGMGGIDFLRSDRVFANIVTNPPYNSAEGFVSAGLRQCNRKLALLLRLAFLEGGNRYRTIFSQVPPARIWAFSERITFYMAGAERKGSGTTAYAWFIWDKNVTDKTTMMKWLPPGYKARFSSQSEIYPMLFK